MAYRPSPAPSTASPQLRHRSSAFGLVALPLAAFWLLSPEPAAPPRPQDISVEWQLDGVHRTVDAMNNRVPSGAGTNDIRADADESLLYTYPDAWVGRNRAITLHRRKGNHSVSTYLDLAAVLGCAQTGGASAGVDVDGTPGCDPCVDGAPLLPATQFGVPTSTAGFPDRVNRFGIEGEDYDDIEVGCDLDARARYYFEVDGQEWALYWGPFRFPGGATFNPDSDPIRVIRTHIDRWHFETTGEHRAALYSNGVYYGQVVVRFSGQVIAYSTPSTPPPGCDNQLVMGDPACATGPVVSITSPANGATFPSGVAAIDCTGTAVDLEDGDVSASLEWYFNTDTLPFGFGPSVSLLAPPDGTHTIRAEATDSGGFVGSDSISVTVGAAPPVATATVDSVVYTTSGGPQGGKHLDVTITVVDSLSSAGIPGATVTIELYRNGAVIQSAGGVTDTNGVVAFRERNHAAGDYETVVTGVIAAGYDWDGLTPPNGYTK